AGNRSTYFTVAFPGAAAADDPQGDLYFPKRAETAFPLAKTSQSGNAVTFDVPHEQNVMHFSGTLAGDTIRGNLTIGATSGTFFLQHLIRESPKLLDAYTGTYRAVGGEIGIARPYTYIMFLDKRTGHFGFLWPDGTDRFFTGPSKGI